MTGASSSVVLRVLVHRDVACKLIGKGGGTISAIRTLTKTTINLSHCTQFYPGTHDRCAKISGDVDAVQYAVKEILSRFWVDCKVTFSILVPAQACGLLIGRGGETINTIKQDTKAFIVLNNDSVVYGERICQITGAPDAVQNAAALIIDKLTGRGDLFQYDNSSAFYLSFHDNRKTNKFQFAAKMAMYDNQQFPTQVEYAFQLFGGQYQNGWYQPVQQIVQCSDQIIELLIANNGIIINDLSIKTGTQIQVICHEVGYKRFISIIGSPLAVSVAENFIAQLCDN